MHDVNLIDLANLVWRVGCICRSPARKARVEFAELRPTVDCPALHLSSRRGASCECEAQNTSSAQVARLETWCIGGLGRWSFAWWSGRLCRKQASPRQKTFKATVELSMLVSARWITSLPIGGRYALPTRSFLGNEAPIGEFTSSKDAWSPRSDLQGQVVLACALLSNGSHWKVAGQVQTLSPRPNATIKRTKCGLSLVVCRTRQSYETTLQSTL